MPPALSRQSSGLLAIFTGVIYCSLLLCAAGASTAPDIIFHLSFSPFPQNISLQAVKWISTGVQGHPPPPMCAPLLGTSLDPQSCPTPTLPVPSFATCPWAIARSSSCPVAPLESCTWEQEFHETTEHPGGSQPIPSSPAGTLHSLYTSQAALPLWLQGCSPSLSFLWAVTSTSVKHWCLSKGEIWGSHFLSKHSC